MIHIKYPKINTLWKRDEKTHNIIEGYYSKDEFGSIHLWEISEKIDGQNIRVEFETRTDEASAWQDVILTFKGREMENDADIPKPLLEYLKKTFNQKQKWEFFPNSNHIILFGEGYGGNIQSSGRYYRDDVSFILFDVWIDGWWLERENVKDIADKLGIQVVPSLRIMDTEGAVSLVKKGFLSMISNKVIAEGIVARSVPQMLFRDKTPIMWKLKFKDYLKLK